MWTAEFHKDTDAPARAVWRLWSNVPNWPEWNPGLRSATIDGPFATGSTIHMELPDGEVITLELVQAEADHSFTDQATMDGIVVRTLHHVGDGQITYRVEISGPEVDTVGPELGPQITADLDQVLDMLAEAASPRGRA